MANNAGFDAYICGESFGDRSIIDEAVSVREQLQTVREFISIGRAAAEEREGVTRLQPQAANEADEAAVAAYREAHPNDPNDCTTICWTSGTEGQPKGVMRAHYDWLNFSWAVLDALNGHGSATDDSAAEIGELDHNDVLLNPFPLINMAGVCGMLLPLSLIHI